MFVISSGENRFRCNRSILSFIILLKVRNNESCKKL